MLKDLFNGTVTDLSVLQCVVAMCIALGFGLIISLTYWFTNRAERSSNMFVTILILPTLIGTVIMLIGNNIAGAFSLAGIFAVIKFRSAPGSSKEILYILFCVAIGLSIGVYEFLIGLIITLVLSGVMFLLAFLRIEGKHTFTKQLKMLVPEDEDVEALLTPTLTEYANKFELAKMATKDLGSIFEVTYLLSVKDESKNKEFLDKLRTLNGNLKISLNKILKNGDTL